MIDRLINMARIGFGSAGRGLAGAAGLVALLFPVSGFAQSTQAICNQIRSEIAALDRGGERGGGSARNTQRLQTELSRVRLALQRNDCNQRGFFFSPPPVCGPLAAQAAQLEGRLRQAGGGGALRGPDAARRGQLVAAYHRYDCDGTRQQQAQRGVIYAGPREPSLFDRLFGGESAVQVERPEVPPIDPELAEELREKARLGGRMAICVRTCDGFFFPVNFEGLARGDGYEDVCKALCPSAETRVFFMRNGAEIETAATRSGEAYASMPYARQYQQSRDPACFCKPQSATWAQLSKTTEDIVEARKGDMVVTPEQAAAMSRPKEFQAPPLKKKTRKQLAAEAAAAANDTPQPVPDSQIPTAGTASAGIGPRDAGTAVLGREQGNSRAMTGADGTQRRIRVISPLRSEP